MRQRYKSQWSPPLDRMVDNLSEYMESRYGTKVLTNHQAVKELGLSRGRELGTILYTPRLPDLSVRSIARYIALYM